MSNVDIVSPANMVEIQIDGQTTRVPRGCRSIRRGPLQYLLQWGETYPETYLGYECRGEEPAEEPDTTPPSELDGMVATIALLADQVAHCGELDARDRNAVIGQLRAAAGMLRGFAGLPGFRQAPFAPTTR